MFSLFKKEKESKSDENHLSLTSVAALLVHSAKIDQNFTEKEKDIIKRALIEKKEKLKLKNNTPNRIAGE